MRLNYLVLTGAIALAGGCASEQDPLPPPPLEVVEVLSDGTTYVSSVNAVYRDGRYVLAWTEWTEAEAIGKIARLGAGCTAAGDVREIFRRPLAPPERLVENPVVIALEARGDRVAVLTAGNAPATEADAVLWIAGTDVRGVSLGRVAHASMTSTDRALDLAYQSYDPEGIVAGSLEIASIDWTTLETTTRSFDAETMYVEPGFGAPGRVAIGLEQLIGVERDALVQAPFAFDWGSRWVSPNAFGATAANLAFVAHGGSGDPSELLEIDRAGNLVGRRLFPRERTAARLVDAGGIAALWVDADLAVEPRVRTRLFYTPPSSDQARTVAELGDEVAFIEHYGYRSTIAGASGDGEILAAFTLGLGDWWSESGEQRPSELRVRCFDARGADLEPSPAMLTRGEPLPPPIRDPSSCGPDGYDLSSPAYARDDGSFSLTLPSGGSVTSTCTMYGGEDAVVRFTAPSAGAYTFLGQGSQLWALDARTTCEDPATSLACDELLDFHATDPFGPPRSVRVPLEAGQTIWLVLDGCQGGGCEYTLTALPPLAIGAPCDGRVACEEGTACIGGFCTTPTPPSLTSSTVYHHSRARPDGTVEERIMVIAVGSDLTVDVRRVLVWPDAGEVPIVFPVWSDDASFTVKARASAPVPSGRFVRVALEDATDLRSETLEVELVPAPLRRLDELCDREEIEDVCAAGLACTEVSPGTTLCR
jgi:hypothetical protein